MQHERRHSPVFLGATICAVLLILLVAGCGGDKADTSESPSADPAEAQPEKMHRIGFLSNFSDSHSGSIRWHEAFRQGLRDHGRATRRQTDSRRAPQSLQNFASVGFSCWHCGQFISPTVFDGPLRCQRRFGRLQGLQDDTVASYFAILNGLTPYFLPVDESLSRHSQVPPVTLWLPSG